MRLLLQDLRTARLARLGVLALVLSMVGVSHPADAQTAECEAPAYNDMVTADCLPSKETDDCDDPSYNERMSVMCDLGDATEPDVTDPDTTDPDTTEPDTTEPDATRPAATEPDATRPAIPNTQPDDQASQGEVPEGSRNLGWTVAVAIIASLGSLVVVVRRRRPVALKEQSSD